MCLHRRYCFSLIISINVIRGLLNNSITNLQSYTASDQAPYSFFVLFFPFPLQLIRWRGCSASLFTTFRVLYTTIRNLYTNKNLFLHILRTPGVSMMRPYLFTILSKFIAQHHCRKCPIKLLGNLFDSRGEIILWIILHNITNSWRKFVLGNEIDELDLNFRWKWLFFACPPS